MSSVTVVLQRIVYEAMDMEAAGINVLYLATTGIGYFAIALLLDFLLASPLIRQKFVRSSKRTAATSAQLEEIEREDSDVAAERARIRAGGGAQDVLTIRVSFYDACRVCYMRGN